MKLNLYNYKGFCFQSTNKSKEFNKLFIFCIVNNIPIIKVKNKELAPKNFIPSGSVEWCLSNLNYKVTPNYYPKWLTSYLYRKVWKGDNWILNKRVFVKPSDKYKRFTGFVTYGTYAKKKKPPFWYSDIVSFTNEWRYYISNGKILCGEWYLGESEQLAPELSINIPQTYCGALDFGTLSTGEFALVEAQHPFACGWYGENIELYAQWLIDGWKYMQINDN
jgi:hypothetical protein